MIYTISCIELFKLIMMSFCLNVSVGVVNCKKPYLNTNLECSIEAIFLFQNKSVSRDCHLQMFLNHSFFFC